MDEIKIRSRGYLPHWERIDGVYFITFRLVDSLPKAIIDKYFEKKEAIERVAKAGNIENHICEKRQEAKLLMDYIDNSLDSGHGKCHLSNAEIANLVAGALRFFDGKRYELFSWCIMPNHVHVVVRIFDANKLASVLHSWKTYTAREANKILGCEGSFWQREYYDHLIRNDDELFRTIIYVLENPIKSNLKDWKWVWAIEEIS